MILYYRSVSKHGIFLDHLFLMLRNHLVALMFGGVWWLPCLFFKLGIVGGSAMGVQLGWLEVGGSLIILQIGYYILIIIYWMRWLCQSRLTRRYMYGGVSWFIQIFHRDDAKAICRIQLRKRYVANSII